MKCRHCKKILKHIFLDLGWAPLSNAYLTEEDLSKPEMTFPLRLYVCENCWLVQTEDYADHKTIFSKDYAYFSSTSQTQLNHARSYSEMIIKRLNLTSENLVIEVASNDGYLLRNFLTANIPCLGIEPTLSTASTAEKIGIPVLNKFFNTTTAEELVRKGQLADLICANNVYAHVADINDFTCGLKLILKKGGTLTLEFPHIMKLIEYNQFDTVYHEHFSYLSLYAVMRIFARAGLRVYDVEELDIHGGSLRVYGCHEEDPQENLPSLKKLLANEYSFGLQDLKIYQIFQKKADKVKNDFLNFLITQKNANKTIAAYGAAAKGNTLLNYAGIKRDLISFVCDASLSKQNKYLPGSKIPILSPDVLNEKHPDWIVVLPWNIMSEITQQLSSYNKFNFIVAVPQLRLQECMS